MSGAATDLIAGYLAELRVGAVGPGDRGGAGGAPPHRCRALGRGLAVLGSTPVKAAGGAGAVDSG